MPDANEPYDAGSFYLHEPTGTGAIDILGSPVPQRRRRGALSTVLGVGVSLTAVVVAGGAVLAYNALSGGGPQPDRYAPASTFAYVKLDLDPSAGEKIAAYRFLKKFPSDLSDKLNSADSLKDDLLGAVLPQSVRYETDFKPWVGDRVAVAGYLDDANKPQAVAILQIKNAGKARTELAKLRRQLSSIPLPLTPSFGYVLKSDYAIVGSSQHAAQEAVDLAKQGDISTNHTYTSDVAALGGGRIATAWLDLGEVAKQVRGIDPFSILDGIIGDGSSSSGSGFGFPGPGNVQAPSARCLRQFEHAIEQQATDPFSRLSPACRRTFFGPGTGGAGGGVTVLPPPPSSVSVNGRVLSSVLVDQGITVASRRSASPVSPFGTLTGRLAVGLHISSNYAELVSRAFGQTKQSLGTLDTRLVTSLPDDTVAAIGAGGLGAAVRKAFGGGRSPFGPFEPFIDDTLSTYGLTFSDIASALGSETLAAVAAPSDATGDLPRVAVRAHPDSLAAARRVSHGVQKLIDESGEPVTIASRVDGSIYSAANDKAWLDAVAGHGSLGDSGLFATAVGPLDGTVQLLGYADVRRLVEVARAQGASEDDVAVASKIDAVGFVDVVAGDTATFRMRVVVS